MIKVDRMRFPNRYRPNDISIILVIIAAFIGIWLNGHSQRKLKQEVLITNVRVVEFSNQAINLDYRIENLGKNSREVKLLARVADSSGQELASALFIIEVPAKTAQDRNKILDKLNFSLPAGEIPGKAEITIYERRVL